MSHTARMPTPGKRPTLTHFIGLSLVTPASRPQLQASIATFRDAVIDDKELLIPEAVANEAIRPVDSLHLTICTLSLPAKQPERLQEVISHLKELDLKKLWQEAYSSKLEWQKAPSVESAPKSESIDIHPTQPQEQSSEPSSSTDSHEVEKKHSATPPPLKVTLKGVGKFRNASKTTVVYAPPYDPTGSLQRFCEAIREDFRPYLPKLPEPRYPDFEAAKEEEPVPAAKIRPTPESFPHPDSYKFDISVRATSAPPQPSTESVHLASLTAEVSQPSSAGEANISHREQKRRAKEEKGELPALILHATLLNTVYMRKLKQKNRRPVTIDARPSLERFKDTMWMKDVRIEKLCLFRMGAKEMMDENGKGTGIVRYVPEVERELDF